jgi:hypothetical protein
MKGQHITVAAGFFPHFFTGCTVGPTVVEYRPVKKESLT